MANAVDIHTFSGPKGIIGYSVAAGKFEGQKEDTVRKLKELFADLYVQDGIRLGLGFYDFKGLTSIQLELSSDQDISAYSYGNPESAKALLARALPLINHDPEAQPDREGLQLVREGMQAYENAFMKFCDSKGLSYDQGLFILTASPVLGTLENEFNKTKVNLDKRLADHISPFDKFWDSISTEFM